MGLDRFGSDRTPPAMKLLRAGCCKRIPSAYVRAGRSCVTACGAQGFRSRVLHTCPSHVALGAGADRVVADAFGMHPEFLIFRDHRIDAVEQTLVERRKRIGCTRLTK